MAQGCGSPSIPKRKVVTDLLGLHTKATFPCLGLITFQLLPLSTILHPKNAKHFIKIT